MQRYELYFVDWFDNFSKNLARLKDAANVRVNNTTDVNQICVHLKHFSTVQCLSKCVLNKSCLLL